MQFTSLMKSSHMNNVHYTTAAAHTSSLPAGFTTEVTPSTPAPKAATLAPLPTPKARQSRQIQDWVVTRRIPFSPVTDAIYHNFRANVFIV